MKIRNCLFLLFALCSGYANAEFIDDLHAKFPATSGAKVEKAFGNFYSVTKGNEVIFVSDDLHYLINGDVVDLIKNKSITQELQAAARPKINVADLNLNDAIKVRDGKRGAIYVLSDPECPWCRKLEGEFNSLHDVAVYVFPFPLAGIHPNAQKVSEWIWCSDNRATVWHSYLTGKSIPASKNGSCDTPIARNLALGEKYQISGTPAIIFADGSITPGLIPASQIQAKVESLSK